MPVLLQEVAAAAVATPSANKIALFVSDAGVLSYKDETGTVVAITATADAELNALAGLVSAANRIPMFSGSGTATLLTLDTDTTLAADSDSTIASQKAVKAYVLAQIAALVASSPSALDTLNELAAALGNDANFATTVTNALAAKAALAGATFTGAVEVPDDAYDATGWNGSTEVPTKNAVRDAIEAVSAGAPAAHATSHQSGGGDAIKLDDLAAPDDNTDLDGDSSTHGLLKKVGTAGQRLKSDGTNQQWVDDPTTIPFMIDGGGAVITTGFKGGVQVDFAGTIVAATVLAMDGLTGSIVVDIWKDTYANHPPTVADTITASAKPTITTDVKATDATLTGWTATVAAGDILVFNVDSVTTFQRVLVSLKVQKS